MKPVEAMKLPFDEEEATRSIVRVMRSRKNSGCGFVVAEEYVFTAAHCLPRIPRYHFDDRVTVTIRSWDGGDETRLPIIHCDLMSDIAILSNDPNLPTEWAEAFDRIVAGTGSARIDLSFPVELPLRFYIRTHKGVWVTGSTDRMFFLRPMFSAPIDEGKEIPGGTSGSPVFNQKGEVIGLVSSGGTSNLDMVWLAGALQGWLIGELKGTGRSHEQIKALLQASGVLTDAMNEEKDLPEGVAREGEAMSWEELYGDTTEAEANELCYDFLAQAEAHMAEAKALRGSWDELAPEAKKCWELQDSAMLRVTHAKKLFSQHHKVLK